MEDLSLMRHITIGQYLPTGSVLHRLDPRTKILGSGVLMSGVVVSPGITRLFIALMCILGFVAVAKIPIGIALGVLRPTLPPLVVIAVLQALFGWHSVSNGDCLILWDVWIIHMTACSLLSVVSMFLRLVAMILLTGLLTMTSTISELNHGLESLLHPFRRLGLPAHELAMVFTIALRFVPTMAEELEKLLKAQVARGADIRLGANPIQRTRHFLPVLVPLFVTTLRRGDLLVEAMEARGYSGSQGRSRLVRLKLSFADILVLILIVILVGVLIVFPFQVIDHLFQTLIFSAVGN